MKTVATKKEMVKEIEHWTTDRIQSDYIVGSNRIEVTYNGKSVAFESDSVKDVAYIALECHAINNKQYADLAFQ